MDVKQIIEKREDLEFVILGLINEFERDTGVSVAAVDMPRYKINEMGGKTKSATANLKLRIEL